MLIANMTILLIKLNGITIIQRNSEHLLASLTQLGSHSVCLFHCFASLRFSSHEAYRVFYHCNSLSETVEVVKPINLKVDKFLDFEHIYFVGIIRMSFHILGFSFWKLSEIFITNLILISVIGKHFKDRLVKSKIFLP